MKVHISESITDKFVKNEIITPEDRELYTYGLEQGFLIVLNVITTIFIGIIFGMVWEIVIFLLAYTPLRTYAGGYHARTQIRCYLFSIIMMVVVLLGIKYIPWTDLISLILAFAAGVIILFLAPVEDSNKPLSHIEKLIYKRQTQVVLYIILLIAMISYTVGQPQISFCIIIAIVTISIMLILAKINNLFKYYNIITSIVKLQRH